MLSYCMVNWGAFMVVLGVTRECLWNCFGEGDGSLWCCFLGEVKRKECLWYCLGSGEGHLWCCFEGVGGEKGIVMLLLRG